MLRSGTVAQGMILLMRYKSPCCRQDVVYRLAVTDIPSCSFRTRGWFLWSRQTAAFLEVVLTGDFNTADRLSLVNICWVYGVVQMGQVKWEIVCCLAVLSSICGETV